MIEEVSLASLSRACVFCLEGLGFGLGDQRHGGDILYFYHKQGLLELHGLTLRQQLVFFCFWAGGWGCEIVWGLKHRGSVIEECAQPAPADDRPIATGTASSAPRNFTG